VKKVKYALVGLCSACADLPLTVATVEEKPAPAPVLWRAVLPRLFLASLLGASAWGLTLQWLGLHQKRVSLMLMVVLHLGYGIAVAALVIQSRTGITWALRLVVTALVVVAVLAGNLWAYQTFLEQQLPGLPWKTVLQAYFKVQLPNRLALDLKCMVAAGFGAFVALTAHRVGGAKYLVLKRR
jgi:hypothetical protein